MSPSPPSHPPRRLRHRRWAPPVHRVSLPYLLVVPVLLAVATFAALFLRSDVNVALLWSQCHARERIPALSRIPVLGMPLCSLVSFFQAAGDSLRSGAVMGAVLAFVGGLLATGLVESARRCNAPGVIIANPTGPWLVFNLVGGAVVWQLLIIPAFLHRARTRSVLASQTGDDDSTEAQDSSAEVGEGGRHVSDAEAVAIPVGVLVGYVMPSILMLVFNTPAAIGVWLFFPIYVSAVRRIVRLAVGKLRSSEPQSIHLESRWASLVLVYAAPVVCSVLAHVVFLWSLTRPDDRREMTRSTIKFIEIDIQFIGWTVLYWTLVEVGWRVPLAMVIVSAVLGPGAGICLAWVYRERLIVDGMKHSRADEEQRGEGAQDRTTDEETPLLQ